MTAIVQYYVVLYLNILNARNLDMVKSKGYIKAKYYRNNFL